ncbi:trimeric intracellular cation channel family protein [Streptococcus sp. DD13]|uniref:trimeric intracellular cation channel family protein n=1 Tax=Streptococcus sp. DD13 TaxID=1777881 RepID=UPI000794CB36|nr:trimeric intracellular cation channel family protein [Streptococcus sp. DD13]KXT77323.1 hypothetical protein STRDD13_01533 [Streptococcus sp. DD13]
MDFSLFLLVCNYIGTIAFAASGVMKGFKKELDIFGITILAIVTAVGGGMIRDLMITRIPMALQNPDTILLSTAVAIIMYLFMRQRSFQSDNRKSWILFLSRANQTFDAIGLAIFALIGASASVQLHLNLVTTGILAALTGAGGGLLRDIFANETPSILKEDIYAVLAFVAGVLYQIGIVHLQFPQIPTYLFLFLLTLLIRLLVIRYHLNLPGTRPRDPRQ